MNPRPNEPTIKIIFEGACRGIVLEGWLEEGRRHKREPVDARYFTFGSLLTQLCSQLAVTRAGHSCDARFAIITGTLTSEGPGKKDRHCGKLLSRKLRAPCVRGTKKRRIINAKRARKGETPGSTSPSRHHVKVDGFRDRGATRSTRNEGSMIASAPRSFGLDREGT